MCEDITVNETRSAIAAVKEAIHSVTEKHILLAVDSIQQESLFGTSTTRQTRN